MHSKHTQQLAKLLRLDLEDETYSLALAKVAGNISLALDNEREYFANLDESVAILEAYRRGDLVTPGETKNAEDQQTMQQLEHELSYTKDRLAESQEALRIIGREGQLLDDALIVNAVLTAEENLVLGDATASAGAEITRFTRDALAGDGSVADLHFLRNEYDRLNAEAEKNIAIMASEKGWIGRLVAMANKDGWLETRDSDSNEMKRYGVINYDVDGVMQTVSVSRTSPIDDPNQPPTRIDFIESLHTCICDLQSCAQKVASAFGMSKYDPKTLGQKVKLRLDERDAKIASMMKGAYYEKDAVDSQFSTIKDSVNALIPGDDKLIEKLQRLISKAQYDHEQLYEIQSRLDDVRKEHGIQWAGKDYDGVQDNLGEVLGAINREIKDLIEDKETLKKDAINNAMRADKAEREFARLQLACKNPVEVVRAGGSASIGDVITIEDKPALVVSYKGASVADVETPRLLEALSQVQAQEDANFQLMQSTHIGFDVEDIASAMRAEAGKRGHLDVVTRDAAISVACEIHTMLSSLRRRQLDRFVACAHKGNLWRRTSVSSLMHGLNCAVLAVAVAWNGEEYEAEDLKVAVVDVANYCAMILDRLEDLQG